LLTRATTATSQSSSALALTPVSAATGGLRPRGNGGPIPGKGAADAMNQDLRACVLAEEAADDLQTIERGA